MSAPREVWVLVDEQGAAFVLDDGHDAELAALKFPMDRRPTVHRYTLATSPAVGDALKGACTEHGIVDTRWIEGAHRCEVCGEPTTPAEYSGSKAAPQFAYTPPAVGIVVTDIVRAAVSDAIVRELQVAEDFLHHTAIRHGAARKAQAMREWLANTPPAVSTEATVWVDGETMAALHTLSKHTAHLSDEADNAFHAHVNRCRVAPEVAGE